MAAFDAILRIKALVLGEGSVQGLAARLGGLQTAAGKASTGFKGLAGSVGGLVPGLQSLIPLVTGAGLTAMATSAINAADNLNDMRQKTGVSVERLSQLQQAAEKSGTTIEGVSSALIKYNRAIVEGRAEEALKGLGISATDASGKLKSTDQVLLEVADRFATMPDGAAKTAAAIQLFGRAGADMIPLLNGGSESIKGLAVTMTGEFASAADQFNDKMVDLRTGLARIGVGLGTALMPLLIATTDAVTGMVSAFGSLPGPLQTTIAGVTALGVALVVLAPAISSIITIAGALAGLKIGATIAGWAAVAGPAITAITAAFSGFLAFLTGTLLPALVAFFSGPVGWTVLAVAAVVAMAVAFREPIMQFVSWLGSTLSAGFAAAWELVKGPVMAYWEWWKNTATWALEALMAIAYQIWVRPWAELWNKVLREPVTAAATWLQATWTKVTEFLPEAMGRARDAVVSVWTSVVGTIRSVVNQVMRTIGNAINGAVGLVNNAIAAFNRLPGPDIGFVQRVGIPQFASGGYVTRPTIAQIGEGGEPEYVVPRSKAGSFASNIMQGRTGAQALMPDPWGSRLINAQIAYEARAAGGFLNPMRKRQIIEQFANRDSMPNQKFLQSAIQRYLPHSRERIGQGGVAFSRIFPSGARTIEKATGTEVQSLGPVEIKQNIRVNSVQRSNGEDMVSLAEAQRMASNAAQDAVNQMIRLLQQPSFQQQVGLR